MLWIIAPILITLFLVQLYFGRHKEEELGWNTAYGNAIVLIFVTTNLLRSLYQNYGMDIFEPTHPVFPKTVIVSIGIIQAIFLFFIDFSHLLPKKISFFLSNSVSVNISAFIVIVLVYGNIPLDNDTLLTAIIFLIVAYIFFYIFRWLIPPTAQAERFLEHEEAKKEDKKRERERKLKEETRKIDKRIERKISGAKDSIHDNVKTLKRYIKQILK